MQDLQEVGAVIPALEAEVAVVAEDEVAGLVSVLCYYTSSCTVIVTFL